MRIFLPKSFCTYDCGYGPFFFLAGPVRGGGDWQSKCCTEIRKLMPNFYAALPCRYSPEHPLVAYKQAGNEIFFDRQLTWERAYIKLAATQGCLLFWLPAESKDSPRVIVANEPYAMDTRGELGEWRGRLAYDHSLRVVIGAEADFPGRSQIERNFKFAVGPTFPIYHTLEETVVAAIKKTR